jgi:hypothetical protein
MNFLCLAYGAAKDWEALTKEQQEELLAKDEALRQRGTLMAAVESNVISVKAWDGKPDVTQGAFANPGIPLAGFSVIEADNLDQVVHLVAGTPCARAKGAIEIRPILAINEYSLVRA